MPPLEEPLLSLATDLADYCGLGLPIFAGYPIEWYRDDIRLKDPGAKAWWYLVRGKHQLNTGYHLPQPPRDLVDPLQAMLYVRQHLGLGEIGQAN